VFSNSASKIREGSEVGISREVDELKNTLNRIHQNVSNNNSFEKDKENGVSHNSNMILGGLKEKLQNKNDSSYKPDLPQFPMK